MLSGKIRLFVVHVQSFGCPHVVKHPSTQRQWKGGSQCTCSLKGCWVFRTAQKRTIRMATWYTLAHQNGLRKEKYREYSWGLFFFRPKVASNGMNRISFEFSCLMMCDVSIRFWTTLILAILNISHLRSAGSTRAIGCDWLCTGGSARTTKGPRGPKGPRTS